MDEYFPKGVSSILDPVMIPDPSHGALKANPGQYLPQVIGGGCREYQPSIFFPSNTARAFSMTATIRPRWVTTSGEAQDPDVSFWGSWGSASMISHLKPRQ